VAVPIVIVPVRLPDAVFGCTVYVTVPLPVPEVPPVIVIHDVVVLAVQANPAVAVSETVRPAPPPIGAASVVFEIANVGVPAWFTVNVSPPIVRVPILAIELGLAVTSNVITPVPAPMLPLVMDNHPAFDTTAQRTHGSAETRTVRPPTATAGTDSVVDVMDGTAKKT
jgi:hypothetical protein